MLLNPESELVLMIFELREFLIKFYSSWLFLISVSKNAFSSYLFEGISMKEEPYLLFLWTSKTD
jgi:hypothetical protein